MKFNELRKEPKYDYSNESDEHKHTKEDILHKLWENDHVDRLYVREEFDDFDVNRVPDIGGIHNGKQLAIEVVHLNDDYTEYSKKKNEYHKNNIYDIWVFTSERMHEYIDEDKAPSDMMVDLLRRYGCIYYYQINKLLPVRYVDGCWKESLISLDITWDNLCFAELKYKKYYCAEQKYEVDWLVAETEEFVKYREHELETVEKELKGIPEKKENKPHKGYLKMDEGETVRCRYIANDVDKYGNDVVVLSMGKYLKTCYHVNLVRQLSEHMDELCDITLEECLIDGNDNKRYIYDVEFVE